MMSSRRIFSADATSLCAAAGEPASSDAAASAATQILAYPMSKSPQRKPLSASGRLTHSVYSIFNIDGKAVLSILDRTPLTIGKRKHGCTAAPGAYLRGRTGTGGFSR